MDGSSVGRCIPQSVQPSHLCPLLMSALIWHADQQGKASAVVVLAAALRAAAEAAQELAASASPVQVPAAAAERAAAPPTMGAACSQWPPGPDERQPAAHEAGQREQTEAIAGRPEDAGCCSAAQLGGGSGCDLQLTDVLLEAANVLLEAAAGLLGAPLRRHLLSAAADVHRFAGGWECDHMFAGRNAFKYAALCRSTLPDHCNGKPQCQA